VVNNGWAGDENVTLKRYTENVGAQRQCGSIHNSRISNQSDQIYLIPIWNMFILT